MVIGVHSAKFTTEKQTDSIRQAVLRHNLTHPVVNDADFAIWKSYGVRGWPTLILVDPEGYVVGQTSGEGQFDVLDKGIGMLVKKFDARKKIDRRDLVFVREKAPDGVLSYPGKITASLDPKILVISDTNHNRLLVTDWEGKIQHTIGSGAAGFADGDFASARFNQPEGTALRGDSLYVADTENHAVRLVDLRKKTVSTIAGTGKQVWQKEGGPARQTPLNSPWDLALDGDRCYIAMAGDHRIWRLDLAKGRVEPFAGSGRENIADGTRLEAAFAQPSGLALANGTLYVADSEVSGIRAIDLKADGRVRTIVGEGLFEFGDADGTGKQVRLQHVLGIAWGDDRLYVADTYNSKIKIADPARRSVTSWCGSGRPGRENGIGSAASFGEPNGLSVAGDRVFVADTNNHAIRVIDRSSGQVTTLEIR